MTFEKQITNSDFDFNLIIKKSISLGYDLQQYKTSFLKRRIEARMRARGLHNYSQYSDLLDVEPSECQSLFGAISINVTEFFRNPDVFSAFSTEIMPILLSKRSPYPTLRIWSAGCATGEEPYSLAILLYEKFAKNNLCDFRIYATDISLKAIESARSGKYTLHSLKNIPANLLHKYFKHHANGEYEVIQEIKNLVKFNVGKIETFPITHLDVIFCRNVLIYVEKHAQQAIFQKFHSLLKQYGYLILGMDESMRADQFSLFESMSIRQRIYEKK